MAGGDQAAEGQAGARHRQPAAGLEHLQAGVASRHGPVEVGRRGQQGATHRSCVPCGLSPMRHHDAAAAVRDDDHRLLGGGHLPLDGLDARRAIQVLAPHRRHAAHLRQARRQQCLPMLAHMVAQAGDDQYGGRICLGHRVFLSIE